MARLTEGQWRALRHFASKSTPLNGNYWKATKKLEAMGFLQEVQCLTMGSPQQMYANLTPAGWARLKEGNA